MQSDQIEPAHIDIPVLATPETESLRADYPSIEHLEAGNVAAWLMERQEQLLIRAGDERTGMNLAKLITLAGGAVGAVCYATSPLALIGGMVAGVGYVWALCQDLNETHCFAPLPFVRGDFLEFLQAMGDRESREEWFANQNELVTLMNHLCPMEKYEFGMLKTNSHTLTDFLARVEPGKKFYAYRWLLDWFINLKGEFPSNEMLYGHLGQVTADPRVNYSQVGAIASNLNATQIAYSAHPKMLSSSKAEASSNHLDKWLSEMPNNEGTTIDVTPSEAEVILHANPLINKLAKTTLKCLELKKAPSDFIEAVDGYKFFRLLLRKRPTTNIDAVLNADRDLFCEIGTIMPELNCPPMVSQVRGGRIAVDIPKDEKDWTTALFKNYIVPDVKSFESPVKIIIGTNLDGVLIEIDISQNETCGMIVAGLPGGGKSAWLVAGVCGLICQYTPASVQLIMSDTKQVELTCFKDIPHLFCPIALTVPETAKAIDVAIAEMERRKMLFAQAGVRNLEGYNSKVSLEENLPRLLVIIEESATTATSEETYISCDYLGNETTRRYSDDFNRGKTRVKKEGRFAGIYIIDSTQAPRREVLDPNYRGQFSAFLAFRCSRPEESKIALANQYEEACKLLGKGDALFLNHLGLERVQSLLVSDQEIEAIVNRVVSTYGTYTMRREEERKRKQQQRKPETTPPLSTETSPAITETRENYDEEIQVPPSSFSSDFDLDSSFSSDSDLGSSSNSDSQEESTPNSSLEDYLLIRQLRGNLNSNPVPKGDIIKQHWKYGTRDWALGCDRYLKAIDEHGAEWIKELRHKHRQRISDIVRRVYAQNRKPSEEYQPIAEKVRAVLGEYEADDDSLPIPSTEETNAPKTETDTAAAKPNPPKSMSQESSTGSRIQVWWQDVNQEVPGIILNRRQVGRGKGARTEYLVTTPLGIRWAGRVTAWEGGEFDKKCVRPKPGVIKMSQLPENLTEEYMGAWRFTLEHPDIATE